MYLMTRFICLGADSIVRKHLNLVRFQRNEWGRRLKTQWARLHIVWNPLISLLWFISSLVTASCRIFQTAKYILNAILPQKSKTTHLYNILILSSIHNTIPYYSNINNAPRILNINRAKCSDRFFTVRFQRLSTKHNFVSCENRLSSITVNF